MHGGRGAEDGGEPAGGEEEVAVGPGEEREKEEVGEEGEERAEEEGEVGAAPR